MRRRPGWRLLAMLALVGGAGCAHRREAVFPPGYGRGTPPPKVHVRAPFVDVQVHKAPEAEARRAERDRDDD